MFYLRLLLHVLLASMDNIVHVYYTIHVATYNKRTYSFWRTAERQNGRTAGSQNDRVAVAERQNGMPLLGFRTCTSGGSKVGSMDSMETPI